MCGQSRQHCSGGGRRKRTRATGTSLAAYLTLSRHTSTEIRTLSAHRVWLTVFRLPSYAPELNPAEGIWANLRANLGNLIPLRGGIDELAALIRTRLKRMQYRTDGLLDGFLAETGLSLEPP